MLEILLITSGLSAYLAIYNGVIWLMRRSQRVSLWLALWSGLTFLYQLFRYRQERFPLDEPGSLYLVDWVCFGLAAALIPVIMLAVRELARSEDYPHLPRVAALGLAAVLALHAGTQLFITEGVSYYRDFSGQLASYSTVGPLYVPVLLAGSLSAVVLLVRILRRSPEFSPSERRLWIGAVLLNQAMGGNDLLLFSGLMEKMLPWLPKQPVFEFGVVGLAVALSLRLARRAEATQAQLEDLVERRTRELEAALREARSSVESKAAFLSSVSHEIRTPLNGIIGLTELLLDDPLPEAVRERLELVRRSGKTLKALVDDVLDYSRLDANRLQLTSEEFSLKETLLDVVQLYEGMAQQKGLTLAAEVKSLPGRVRGDELRLKQVTANLVSNAVKFTVNGGVRLVTRALPAEDDQRKVVLQVEVHDTGPGMTPEEQSRLFRPFTQVGVSMTHPGAGGAGLGLAISRQLLTLMGGEVGVRSTPGRGTVFSFSVPLEVLCWPTPPPVAAAAPPQRFQGRVLVAEDNPVNRLVAQGTFRSVGLEATLVSDGLQAVVAVLGGSFGVVFMDCQMPELDGLEATRRLRAAGCTVPIVALTAFASTEDRARCMEAGMSDYLTKPLRRTELCAVLERYLPVVAA